MNHINSIPKNSLHGNTPYQIALGTSGADILKVLQLRPIPLDEVNLVPELIKYNH